MKLSELQIESKMYPISKKHSKYIDDIAKKEGYYMKVANLKTAGIMDYISPGRARMRKALAASGGSGTSKAIGGLLNKAKDAVSPHLNKAKDTRLGQFITGGRGSNQRDTTFLNKAKAKVMGKDYNSMTPGEQARFNKNHAVIKRENPIADAPTPGELASKARRQGPPPHTEEMKKRWAQQRSNNKEPFIPPPFTTKMKRQFRKQHFDAERAAEKSLRHKPQSVLNKQKQSSRPPRKKHRMRINVRRGGRPSGKSRSSGKTVTLKPSFGSLKSRLNNATYKP